MTRREKIMSNFLGVLDDISVANGYLTNIGQYISHWDTQVTKHNDTYDINVKDTVNEHSLGHTETLNIQIDLSCKMGASNYTTINKMILDILKCTYNNTAAISNGIGQQVRILPSQEQIDIVLDKETKKGYAQMQILIEHKFDEKWTPDLTAY